jgi:hypothetical protein
LCLFTRLPLQTFSLRYAASAASLLLPFGELAFLFFLGEVALPLVLRSIFILSFPLLVAEQRQERIKIILKTRVLPPLAPPLRGGAKEAFFVFSPASCSYFYYYNKNNNKNEARAKEFKKTKMLPLQAKRKQGEQR